jgi:hypothetical protein
VTRAKARTSILLVPRHAFCSLDLNNDGAHCFRSCVGTYEWFRAMLRSILLTRLLEMATDKLHLLFRRLVTLLGSRVGGLEDEPSAISNVRQRFHCGGPIHAARLLEQPILVLHVDLSDRGPAEYCDAGHCVASMSKTLHIVHVVIDLDAWAVQALKKGGK